MIRRHPLHCFLITCVGLLFASVACAECVRYQRPTPALPIDPDGPGSWGQLQDTVTLDCLKYVGSTMRQGKEIVFIRDELGKVHDLQVGDFMGENTGRIVKIDATAIYLLQLVLRNGEWEKLMVTFPKH